MKKKILAGILIGLVVLAVGATSAFAAGTGGWHHLSGGRGSCDGTGICTNCGSTGCHGSCYVDADNDGICDNRDTAACANCGSANCDGTCYTDADNDGLCDNRGTAACTNCGSANCGGTCYTDADNDGVCDNQSAVRLGWHAGNSSSGGHSGHGSQGGCHR